MNKKEEQRKKNREDFPTVSEWVDFTRKHFGEGVKVIYARENGKTIGKVPKD